MANRECNGDFFIANDVRYYRCFWYGTVIPPRNPLLGPLFNGHECPHCHRKISGRNVGTLPTINVTFALAPDGGYTSRWEIPEGEAE